MSPSNDAATDDAHVVHDENKHHHEHAEDDHDHHQHHGKVVTSALDPEVEAKGVQAILDGLSEEEKKELVDENMPLRHLRAEKVCVVVD